MTYNKLGYALNGLRTKSFAIIEKAYKKNGEAIFFAEIGFGLDIDNHVVTCNTRFSFEKKKDQPFLILEVQAIFEIKESDFLSKMKQDDGTYLVTKVLAINFAILTISSARGILHSRTEGTVFNEFLLPPMDIDGLIEEDVIFAEDPRIRQES